MHTLTTALLCHFGSRSGGCRVPFNFKPFGISALWAWWSDTILVCYQFADLWGKLGVWALPPHGVWYIVESCSVPAMRAVLHLQAMQIASDWLVFALCAIECCPIRFSLWTYERICVPHALWCCVELFISVGVCREFVTSSSAFDYSWIYILNALLCCLVLSDDCVDWTATRGGLLVLVHPMVVIRRNSSHGIWDTNLHEVHVVIACPPSHSPHGVVSNSSYRQAWV